jgi:hypothetical protein
VSRADTDTVRVASDPFQDGPRLGREPDRALHLVGKEMQGERGIAARRRRRASDRIEMRVRVVQIGLLLGDATLLPHAL